MEKYEKEVRPLLMEQKGTKNNMAVARLEKIVVSMGVGSTIQDKSLWPARPARVCRISRFARVWTPD
jgi:ribosomal protein L5